MRRFIRWITQGFKQDWSDFKEIVRRLDADKR